MATMQISWEPICSAGSFSFTDFYLKRDFFILILEEGKVKKQHLNKSKLVILYPFSFSNFSYFMDSRKKIILFIWRYIAISYKRAKNHPETFISIFDKINESHQKNVLEQQWAYHHSLYCWHGANPWLNFSTLPPKNENLSISH